MSSSDGNKSSDMWSVCIVIPCSNQIRIRIDTMSLGEAQSAAGGRHGTSLRRVNLKAVWTGLPYRMALLAKRPYHS